MNSIHVTFDILQYYDLDLEEVCVKPTLRWACVKYVLESDKRFGWYVCTCD